MTVLIDINRNIAAGLAKIPQGAENRPEPAVPAPAGGPPVRIDIDTEA